MMFVLVWSVVREYTYSWRLPNTSWRDWQPATLHVLSVLHGCWRCRLVLETKSKTVVCWQETKACYRKRKNKHGTPTRTSHYVGFQWILFGRVFRCWIVSLTRVTRVAFSSEGRETRSVCWIKHPEYRECSWDYTSENGREFSILLIFLDKRSYL